MNKCLFVLFANFNIDDFKKYLPNLTKQKRGYLLEYLKDNSRVLK